MKMEVSAMFTKSLPVAILALVLLVVVPGEFATADAAKSVPKFGKAITPEAAAKWDLSVFPDGAGLPVGHGTAAQGEKLFEEKCAVCHGPEGIGASAEELRGGKTEDLSGASPDKNIGAYWPFATTLFDFTRRAMPMTAPGSLSADEVYAVTAYMLHVNGIIGKEDEMTRDTLPKVNMPNRDGFIWIDAKKPR